MPNPCFACLYHPPGPVQPAGNGATLAIIAQEFSPRYEQHHDGLVSIDVSGLERLLGPPQTIGAELVREALARGVRVHVAIAATRTTALVLALARPGLTVVEPGDEATALAPVPVAILEKCEISRLQTPDVRLQAGSAFKRWGVKTLGELAALPPADLAARLGRPALAWRAIACGEDIRPFVPTLPDERFESSLELEWPVDGLEPLSIVLTRLLEPLSIRLERRDCGAAVLHILLRLVTGEIHARRLQLPSPVREMRTLRTLALLDLESHPPGAAVDGVTVVVDPTPGRMWQHTLFTRAQPMPEQLSTLLARLVALMGQDRIGAPATVDSYRPGAFEIKPFVRESGPHDDRRRARGDHRDLNFPSSAASVWRRCRHPVPVRVAIEAGRPVRVTTDRLGFAGGSVTLSVGPWCTSGNWWAPMQSSVVGQLSSSAEVLTTDDRRLTTAWNRDEWDVALTDGGVYRIFRDRETDGWFIDAIVD